MAPFLLLAFGITWTCQLPFVLARAGVAVPPPLVVLPLVVAAVGPALAALLLTPRAQRRELWRWRLRGNLGAIALALSAMPLITLAAGLITHVSVFGGAHVMGPAIGIALLSPVGEELGWRGYLLPRLDPDRHPLRASLIAGVAWRAWHIPYDGVPPPSMWLLLVALSVIMTALWRASGRSLGVAVAAHLGIHVTLLAGLAPPLRAPAVALVAAAVAAVAALVSPASPRTPDIRR